MKNLLHCVVLLVPIVLASFAHADGQDVRGCEFEVKARCVPPVTRASRLRRARSSECRWMFIGVALHGHPPFACTIDSSRTGQNSVWSEDGGATLIANGSPWNPDQPDRVKVTVGRDVSIDLSETQSLGRCGAGAKLPQTIVIPAQGKICRVRLGD